MYNFTQRLKIITYVLMGLGLIGLTIGFLNAPSTVAEAQAMVADAHGGHGRDHGGDHAAAGHPDDHTDAGHADDHAGNHAGESTHADDHGDATGIEPLGDGTGHGPGLPGGHQGELGTAIGAAAEQGRQAVEGTRWDATGQSHG